MMPIEKLFALARRNLGGEMESSARVCLADAMYFWAKDDGATAANRALDSLRYSIGIMHADYGQALKFYGAARRNER